METELRKNKDEFNNLWKEIHDAEKQLKVKKKQKISDKLAEIQLKQEVRVAKNKDSNEVLAKIKHDRQ